jgi:hypothetical protein
MRFPGELFVDDGSNDGLNSKVRSQKVIPATNIIEN